MSVENDPGFWKWMVGGLVTTIGGAWSGFKYIDARLAKKADKHTVANEFHKVEAEQAVHRGYFTKVFDQMRENEQRAQDRHERLMERLTERK